MADSNLKNAKYVYKQLREYLDASGFHYDSNDQEMNVWFAARGNDMRVLADIYVDADMQQIRLVSPFEFKMPKELRNEAAVAINEINYGIVKGRIDYDYESGSIGFSLCNSFEDAVMSNETFHYLVGTLLSSADMLNDKLYLMSEGKISAEQLVRSIFS